MANHEPECEAPCCPWMPQPCDCQCDCDRLRAAYHRGIDSVDIRGWCDLARAEALRGAVQRVEALEPVAEHLDDDGTVLDALYGRDEVIAAIKGDSA